MKTSEADGRKVDEIAKAAAPKVHRGVLSSNRRVWIARKGNEESLRLAESDGWKVQEVAKAPVCSPNSPEDIRQSMNLLQQIHRDSHLTEQLQRERDAWEHTAAEFCRGMEYYRGLLDRIGIAIGKEAYTADDGGVSNDVLRAKVPEIIERLLKSSAHETTASPTYKVWRGELCDIDPGKVLPDGWCAVRIVERFAAEPVPQYECHVCGRQYLTVEFRDLHQEECTDASEEWRRESEK